VRSEWCLRRRVSRTDESNRLGGAATGTPWLRLAGGWRKLSQGGWKGGGPRGPIASCSSAPSEPPKHPSEGEYTAAKPARNSPPGGIS